MICLICLLKCWVGHTKKFPLISDVSKLNNMVVAANSTGMIILGGGVAKHHVCNANSWVRILPVFFSFYLSCAFYMNNTFK